MRKTKVNLQLIIAILLIGIYLLLISIQPINAHVIAIYDDFLMVEQAGSILEGKWLGEYNSLTLIKGAFTPLFMAINSLIGMPFILGQNILYILAITLFINIIKKKIQNKNVLLIIFAFLLFNPIMFSKELCRMYRDGIYVGLIMFLVSSILGIFLNRNESIKRLIGYYIVLGLSFTASYLCREETIWLIPFLAVSTLATLLFIIYDSKCLNKIKKILLYIIPITIFLLSIIVVCSLNYKYYGVFKLNQYWSKEFKEAYGAMTRVLPEQEIEKVPVTRETIRKIGEISPTFKNIKAQILNSSLRWSLCGDGPLLEIQGGWFHWALMEAMESRGYYDNAKEADKFYMTVANEINEACDKGLVECLPNKRVSNTIRFDFDDLIKVFNNTKNTIKYQYNLTAIQVKFNSLNAVESYVGTQREGAFRNISNSEILTDIAYEGTFNTAKINILETIKNAYQFFNKYIFYISIVLYFVILYKFIREPKRLYEEILILTGIFVLYYCRIFVLTFTETMMWTGGVNSMYMAAAYALQFTFSALAIAWGVKEIKLKEIKNKVRKMVKK